jgi:hypothetical protein
MNEPKDILSELAQQAGLHPEWFIDNPEVEKFAELIVRECCQKLENDGMVEVAMELKEHFGVEQ